MYEEIFCYLLGNTYCIFNDYNEFWFISWKIFSWDNSCSQLKNRVQSLTTFSSEILILLLFQNSIGEVTLSLKMICQCYFFSHFYFLTGYYLLYMFYMRISVKNKIEFRKRWFQHFFIFFRWQICQRNPILTSKSIQCENKIRFSIPSVRCLGFCPLWSIQRDFISPKLTSKRLKWRSFFMCMSLKP